MLKIDHLSQEYGGFSLNDICVEIEGGTITGLVGRNGSGKTTLEKMICSSKSFSKGTILYKGKRICELKAEEKQEICYICLENAMFKLFSIKSVVSLCKNLYLHFDQNLFYEYLKRFELDSTKKPTAYSTGEYEKLLFAIAFANKPKLLLVDEATAVMDPVSKAELFQMLKDFVLEEDHAVILATNVLGDLENICDQIILLKNGYVLFKESTDSLYEKYCVFECSKSELENIEESAILRVDENVLSNRIFGYREKINEAFLNRKNTLDEILVYLLREGE